MTQRILVVLDPDSDTPVATDTAIGIARRHSSSVTGLAFVDKDSIGAETAGGGIGSYYYAEKLRASLTDDTRKRAHALLREFIERTEAAGVAHTGDRVDEENVVRSVLDEMRTHDLLVAGRESHFYYAEPEKRTHTIAKVLKDGAAAVLIVGAAPREIKRVAIAYDGSSPSARALQKFAHLSPFGTDLDVELVHVHGTSDEERLASRRLREDAAAYLQAYGYSRTVTTGVESSDPSEEICDLAQGSRADLVVSGAYAKTGFRKLIFGSSATKLLDQAKVPLFLYH